LKFNKFKEYSMDIHQIMESIAKVEDGKYKRDGDTSVLHEPIHGGRWQIVYGKMREIDGVSVGFLFTNVGPNVAKADHEDLLRLNYYLQYSRVAINKENNLCLIAFVDVQKSSFQTTVDIVRELAQRGDGLEKEIFMHDHS
jgi:hypothetical protein